MFQRLEKIACRYERSMSNHIDWEEPILLNMKDDDFVININDSSESPNCEMLLLPDGWYVNGRTNNIPFRNRVRFLEELAEAIIETDHAVSFYLGLSGTVFDEFENCEVEQSKLGEFLTQLVGKTGVDTGFHIRIVQ